MAKYDFGGWATRNDIKCADGRTIRHNAFKDCDGIEVPLVWNHAHDDPTDVLGHALLENREEGVYCYGTFNDTSSGQIGKVLVQHGDIKALSIYANQLKQNGGDVIHGTIREVSLVHAGANPEAYIDTVIAHSEDADEEAIIYNGMNIDIDAELEHADKEEKMEMADETKNEEKGKTLEEIVNTMNEEQKNAMYALIGLAAADANGSKTETKENDDMKHNVFDNDNNENVLMHDALNEIMADGKRYGSLKESFLAHAEEYGIENIDYLNPEEQNYYDRPEFIRNQPTGWIQTVMSGVHHTPFAKVKTIFANITEDEARAKGYIKGKLKKEEVFKLLKRSVSPTTIYKKQKFDRDDLVDVDFDIVPWIRSEMEVMLDEERARAYLFGDLRSAADEDKIDDTKIIPVVSDSELFTIVKEVTPGESESLEHAIIDAAILAQDDYQGSGNTVAFIESKEVSKMLIMEDQFGHRLYKNLSDLAGAMGVGKVEKVPSGVVPEGIYGVILDLNDYNVGQKAQGKKTLFDDFDIDYNQQKYLLETRESAALVRPYSAIVLKESDD